MPRPSPLRPFRPDPAQMARAPDLSGNTINGLGETGLRPPRMVYWATNPDDIPHGQMQKWFYTVDPGLPEFAEERAKRVAICAAPLPEIAPVAAQRSPAAWTAALASFVEQGLCDRVGVCTLDPLWVVEGFAARHGTVIVLAVAHDYEPMTQAPAPEAGAEVMRQYTRAADVAMRVAGWLHDQGWAAQPVTGPMTGAIALIPAAIAAGFGELGKHGSVIGPEFGSSFRLAAVLTDAPFALTPRREVGIDEFCMSCRICEDACPPEAIAPNKQTVRGVEKWYVDFDRCLPFFNQHQGCSICITVCPWSRPGVGLNLAQKLARRAERKG